MFTFLRWFAIIAREAVGERNQMTQYKFGKWIAILTLVLGLLAGSVAAQEGEERPPVERLFITETNSERLPNIEMLMYGRDSQGNPLDLSVEPLAITNNGQPAGPAQYLGNEQVGTLTIFLIDIPTGVHAQLPAIQEAIQQYASPEFMVEQVDAVGVYQVEDTAVELLAPDYFYNSVRNLFATPLTPETNATALYDSTVDLLNKMDSLKPDERMAASIVLITDGTDATSTRSGPPDVINRALELGIPIHTVWLDNVDINLDTGREYLTNVAAGTGGVGMELSNTADLPLIWNRIGSFRDQARITAPVGSVGGGTANLEVSLAGNPDVKATTTAEIPDNVPSVTIDLPPEARALTLPSVDKPVRLRFGITVSWLDGVERQVEAAQLILNGDTSLPYEIPLDKMDNFVINAANLAYGNNTVEAVVVDDQGIRAISPVVLLTIGEGRRDIPDALDGGQSLGRTVLIFLLFVLVAAGFAGLVVFAARKGLLSRSSVAQVKGYGRAAQQRIPRPGATKKAVPAATASSSASQPQKPVAYLEVLDSVTAVASPIPLSETIVRIGRNPNICDIAFPEDVTLSRYHANMMREGHSYRIYDEHSTSGTWVNERQVPEYGTELLDGDEIHLGAVHLRYRRAH